MGWAHRFILIVSVMYLPQLQAYPTPVDFDGKLLRWHIDRDTPTIYYEIDAADDAVGSHAGFIDQAAMMWSAQETSYIRLERATPDVAAHITVKVVGSMDSASKSAGYSIFDQRSSDNRPEHCQIEVGGIAFNGDLGFSKTVLHELGHCLGLGHSVVPQAIMSYELNHNKFALDTDDIAALSRLYSVDGKDPELPPGCSVGATPIPRQINLILLLTPLLWMGIGRMRQGRYKKSRVSRRPRPIASQ